MQKHRFYRVDGCRLCHYSLFTIRSPLRKGMTLVELMVVVTIMVILVTVSIPTFKPMLESQRAAGAARVVAGALQRVRVKAMQDRKTYGLEFVRFETAPNTSVQLRLMREQNAWATPEDLRVVVINGTIHTCSGAWNGANWEWTLENTPDTRWTDVAQTGSKVQFGRQGRFYTLDPQNKNKLAAPYDALTLPDGIDPTATTFPWAVEAMVTRPATGGGLVLAPPVVLPRGTIVDFNYSGEHGRPNFAVDTNGDGLVNVDSNRDGMLESEVDPRNPTVNEAIKVAIMFSPAGFIDGVRDGNNTDLIKTNQMIYFCIGEWERQSRSAAGDTYFDDNKMDELNNLLTPSNYWVTVHPKSGQVRVTQFAAAPEAGIQNWLPTVQTYKQSRTDADRDAARDALLPMVPEVRKFATEHFVDVGGF